MIALLIINLFVINGSRGKLIYISRSVYSDESASWLQYQ